MQALPKSLETLIRPCAFELVNAMMRSYSLNDLMSGGLLVPLGVHPQPLGKYFLEGNLAEFSDVGPWYEARATFRLSIHSGGFVLERRKLINCWFDFCIFNRSCSNFKVQDVDQVELEWLLRNVADFKWAFGGKNKLRY